MLKLWQAIVGVIVGFVGGQLVGGLALVAGLTALLVAGAAEGPAGMQSVLAQLRADPLGSPWVFVPMLAATGLAQTVLALLVPVLSRVPALPALGLDRAPLGAMLLAPVGALALGPVADLVASAFTQLLPWFSFGNLAAINELAKRGPFVVMFVLMAVLPGLSEELLFRGLLQRAIRTAPIAIGVSALVFAGAHLDPPHVVAVLPMGVFLGWVAYRTDSTWPTIAAHIANNGVAVLGTRVSALDLGHGTDTPLPWWLSPIGLAVCGACLVGISLATPRRSSGTCGLGSEEARRPG